MSTYVRGRYRNSSQTAKSSTSRAKLFIVVYVSLVLFLNGLAAASNTYDIANVFATFSLLIAAYPMWHFLRDRRNREIIPYFAVISLIYGLYYGFSVFTSFEIPIKLEIVPRQNIVEASMLSCLGIAIMVSGYFLWPASVRIKELPPLSTYWSERKAKVAAIVFGFVGIWATSMLVISSPSQALQQPIYFVSNLALMAIGILFYLQLRDRLTIGYLIVLWGVLIPFYVLIYLSTGYTWSIIRLFMLLLLLYFAEKRTIPWRLVLLTMVVVFLLLSEAKNEYREAEFTASGAVEISSFDDALDKGFTFVGGIGKFLAQGDPETYTTSANHIVGRLDLLNMFGYVLERTPESVPYLGGESYSDVLWKFIPRIFYPDKPPSSWGQNFGHLYGLLDPTDYTTSVNMPQMIEMYINFGVPGLAIGMLLLSQVYRFLSYLLNHKRAGEWGTVSGAVIFSSLFNIESNFLLIFGNILQFVILFYLLGLLVRNNRSQKPIGVPRLNKSQKLAGMSRLK